nr:sigma-70 family RNA polymerase sigma factor [Pseudomarimonas arenosa]
MSALYPIARRMAARQLGAQAGVSLQPTELVGDVYIRLKQSDPELSLTQPHFMSLLARVLRQVAADHWRHKGRQKRAGLAVADAITQLMDPSGSLTSLVRLDQLLEQLEGVDKSAADIACLRIFGGMTGEEIAEQMEIGTATVTRKWKMASAWLKHELGR